jgi:enamine deaminase RidA (YjgF/YER057c/UK114 family)
MLRKILPVAALMTALIPTARAEAQVARITSNPSALILEAAKVNAGTDLLFVSGQLPAPLDPSKPMSEVKSLDEMGDSKAQTISVLGKIKAILAKQGYAMSDLVKLTLFIAPDPRLGKLDFAGVNEGFKTYFKTPENPETVARSAFQVGALVGPYYLIEIEAIAAKKPGK